MTLLTIAEAASLAGVGPSTWRAYVSRGQAPAPSVTYGRTPLWERAVVAKWIARRPGSGARTDLNDETAPHPVKGGGRSGVQIRRNGVAPRVVRRFL